MVNVKGRLNSRPFCVAMWSTGKDAQKPASAQLLPCLMGTGLRVGVAVGSLLHVEVVPLIGGVVDPGLHAGQECVGGLGRTAGGTVDHGHEFSAGHVSVRAEGAVGIAVDPSVLGGIHHSAVEPVVLIHIGEDIHSAAAGVGELHSDDGDALRSLSFHTVYKQESCLSAHKDKNQVLKYHQYLQYQSDRT